jgi:hypothetical protein
MARARCLFRGTEVTRACRAVEKAGKQVARVEIDKSGKIVLVIGGDEPDRAANPWDDLCRESR